MHGRIKICRNWRSCRVTLPFYVSGRIKTGISEHRTRTIKWLANRRDFFISVINSWGLISMSVIANVFVVGCCFFILGDPTAWWFHGPQKNVLNSKRRGCLLFIR